MRRGMHHVGLMTQDYDRTVDFYTRVLGFEIVLQDLQSAPDGTPLMRHTFFDTGDGTCLAFLAPTPAAGGPTSWAGDINSGLGVMSYSYHFAFWLDTEEELEAKRRSIEENGAEVSEIIDHEFCKSIYFRDPEGLCLEFCVQLREFTEDDKLLKARYQPTFARFQNDKPAAERFAKLMGFPPETFTGVEHPDHETIKG